MSSSRVQARVWAGFMVRISFGSKIVSLATISYTTINSFNEYIKGVLLPSGSTIFLEIQR